jgi:fatty-acyl-CoA synthase
MARSWRPTIAGAVPTIWNGLLTHVRANGGDLSSLRLVPCGGSAVPHTLQEAYEKELGVRIVQAWGMTETSPLGSVAHPPAGTPAEEEWHYRDTQGRLMHAVQGRLVGDGGEELPHDGTSVGEVEVRGPWVTGSYYKDDDPAKFRDGWLRTGDVGTIDRLGFVVLTDRAKDVIKSGGEWISSIDLENLAVGHPKVAEAAVIGVKHPKWDERPLLVVVLKKGQTADRQDILAFMRGKIANWWMPDDVVFVDEIPHTATGKIQKTVLRERFKDFVLPTAAVAS